VNVPLRALLGTAIDSDSVTVEGPAPVAAAAS